MCDVIAIPRCELPDELIAKFNLQEKIRTRIEGPNMTGIEELWFFERERYSLLPVMHEGRVLLYPWGSRYKSLNLPLGGSFRQEDLKAGRLSWLQPQPVEIIATFARSNGFWYDVPQGIQGVAVKDVRGKHHAYMLLANSTHYFRTMTRSQVEPVFMGPQI